MRQKESSVFKAKFPRSVQLAIDTWFRVAELQHWETKSITHIEAGPIEEFSDLRGRRIQVGQDLAVRDGNTVKGHSFSAEIAMTSPMWEDAVHEEHDRGTWKVYWVKVWEYIDGAEFQTYYRVSEEGLFELDWPRHQTA